jgi:4'-phosphopantetheinyl transferase
VKSVRGASQPNSAGSSGDVELWLLDCDQQADALAKIERQKRLVPAAEHHRAGRKHDPADARRWLSGRIALRLLLESRVGLKEARSEFVVAPGGRPALAGDALDFSLSDRGAMLLIGLSRAGRIGVDIETLRPVAMTKVRAARLVAAANGLAAKHAQRLGDADIIAAWTRIEAFAKATATSLAACLSALGTAGHAGHPETIEELQAHAARTREAAGVVVADLSLEDGLLGAAAVPIAAAEPMPQVKVMDALALEL